MLRIITLAALSLASLCAQDATGIWQGTLTVQGKELRIMFKVSKGDDGGLKATMYSIDQTPQPIASSITVQGPSVKINIPAAGGGYEGKMDADGTVLAGTWTQGGKPLPLNLKHVTVEAAWEIPKPTGQLKPMAADAPTGCEVATVKPSKPGAPGKAITMRGPRTLITVNTSLNDLISFAYGVHLQQVTGGPSWFESELYDITCEPEAPGAPNRKHLEGMLRSILSDRFKLTFHHDKKELNVFALVLFKSGSKLTPSASDPKGLPGLGFRGLGDMIANNADMSDFTGVMQSMVLDRPVIDQTELKGRFDFTLKWTPDMSQFGGRGASAKTDALDAPPDLYKAIQEQLGLQLKTTKIPVDVLVIDHVEKPSEN
jgi:bla regulator protein blaR1